MSPRTKLHLGSGAILATLVLFATIRSWDSGESDADSQRAVPKDMRSSCETGTVEGDGDELAADRESGVDESADPNSQKSGEVLGLAGPVTMQGIPEGRFKYELLKLDRTARESALRALGEFQVPFKDLASLHVDGSGHLFYVCSFDKDQGSEEEPPLASASSQQGDTISNGPRTAASISVDTPPVFHSRLGSPNTIFLDFNGPTISGTAWNAAPGRAAIFECLPYNTDSNPAAFGSGELHDIRLIWERVAETFRSFDVNVTTERPAVLDNRTAHAVITAYRDANDALLPTTGPTLGIAYLGHFGDSDYAEKYAVSFNYFPYQSPEELAATISHEVGHNLGLGHDGDPTHEYYYGHAYGDFWWSPIMGSGPGMIQQWSKGEYFGATNQQDDLVIISGKLPILPDDYASGPGSVTPAVIDGSTIQAWGRVERTADPDVFSFAAGEGPASIVVTPEQIVYSRTGWNSRTLEVFAELRDANGHLVKRVDPTGLPSLTLGATLAAGNYTLLVQGVGFGLPTASSPTGFTAYGSIGSYSIEGTMTPPSSSVPAQIVRGPESWEAFAGDWATFEVVARGNPATMHKWQQSLDGGASWTDLADGVDVDGASGRVLTLKNVTYGLDGSRYRCVVSNATGTDASAAATLRVRSGPVIVIPPKSKYVASGSTVTLEVFAIGSPPLRYEWWTGGAAVPGATQSSLTFTGVTSANAGNYTVVVRNRYDAIVGGPVVLGVDTPPQIVTQPQSHGIVVGGDVILSVSAVGAPTLNYQWSKGGAPIGGATSPSLSITSAGEGDSGAYAVSITNPFGSVNSTTATVVVGQAPTISVQPESQSVLAGNPLSLSVVAAGTTPFTYQWSKSGAVIPGATAATLNLGSVSITHEGVYSVRVSNPIGSVESEPALVTVNAVPKFVVQPTPQFGVVGGNATFSVAVTGKPAPALQWFKDGVAIDGAAATSLTLSMLSEADAGSYHAVATNSVGAAESVHGSLTVYPALQTSVSRVATGTSYSLFIREDGSLWGMGRNQDGQLGDGTRETRIIPVKIAEGVASVATGSGHSFFIKTDGTLWAMGHNGFGQLGDGTNITRDVPVQIAQGVVAVAAGGGHSLFIKTDGTLWAMGYGQHGQLGNDSTANQWTPVQVATGVMSIAAGNLHSLFVKLDGTGWATGNNNRGQLGNGTSVNQSVPVQMATGLVEVAAGLEHSLLLKGDGTLLATGRINEGQLGEPYIGSGHYTGRVLPVEVVPGVAAMSAGGNSSTFIKEDGTLWSMGDDTYGQLGRTGNTSPPGQVAEGVVGVSISGTHMVFAGLDGSIWTTGRNDSGQLGDGFTTDRVHPIRIYPPAPPVVVVQPMDQFGRNGSSARFTVAAYGAAPLTYQWLKDGVEISGATEASLTISGITAASVGEYRLVISNPGGSVLSDVASLEWIDEVPRRHSGLATGVNYSLFLKPDGLLWGMGRSYEGQLGMVGGMSNPSPVAVMTDAAAVAAGQGHTMVLKTDGTLWTMGFNYSSQLGYSAYPYSSLPTMVADDVVAIAGGASTSLFVKRDGTLWAMGAVEFGPRESGGPSQVWTGVIAVAAGANHQLLLRVDNTLWGLGYNTSGQLGMGDELYAFGQPRLIATDVSEISAGGEHSLFLMSDGSLYAMGENSSGQLGDGTQIDRNLPTLVATGVARIHAGASHSLFIKTDGSLWGMGSNEAGQLGLGEALGSLIPIQLESDVVEAEAGDSHSMFRRSDGSIWSAGANESGQLGDGGNGGRRQFYRIDPPGAPLIAAQPIKEYGRIGSTVAFRIRADGRGPFYFQWRKNGLPIPGANSATLTLTNVTASDFGSYSVDVSSEFGGASSKTFEFVSTSAITPRVQTLAVGNLHSLILKGGGGLWGMGSNSSGQLGIGSSARSDVPMVVMDGVLSVASGAVHTLILKTDQTLWTTGQNYSGQLGDGTTLSRSIPVRIADRVVTMSAGAGHSLFVKDDGTLWGMGLNNAGQLGDGTSEARRSPVPVATGVTWVSANDYNSYFVRIDGSLWYMGNETSLFGRIERNLPIKIATDVVDVVAANNFAFFRRADGSLWAWGNDAKVIFGLDANPGPNTAVQVAEGVEKFAIGGWHLLYTKSDGSLWGTGGNFFGALGDGTNEDRYAPVKIADGVAAVSTANNASIFVKHDGTVWTMGDNRYGQLGKEGVAASWTPVQIGSINELRINSQLVSRAVVQGESTTLAVSAAAFPAPTYQWLKDGVPVPEATLPTLTIASASASDAGKYSVVVTNSLGSITSNVASLFVMPDPSTSRLINISTRAFAGSGGGTLTVGFTIVGTGQKTVVIRGVGPKLADFNVPVVVEDPKLKLYTIDGTLIAENDNWESVVAANAGGFSLPAGSKDAALELQLPPGGYTVQLINPGALAEGMIEVYDISQDAGSRLVNLSCRMDLAPGQIVIVGTALTGLARPVVVRNSGPGLAQYLADPDKPNAAADPVLHSFDRDGLLVGQNDDWDAELAPYFSVIGAFPLGSGSTDASQRIVIAPGLNTVHATAKGEGGIVLIELYESP